MPDPTKWRVGFVFYSTVNQRNFGIFSFSSSEACSLVALRALTKGWHSLSKSAVWAFWHLQTVWGLSESLWYWRHISEICNPCKDPSILDLCGFNPKLTILSSADSKSKQEKSSDSRSTIIHTMYVNSPGAESGSYSLTFLGKKVGRHHSVAPAGKQRECETQLTSNKHLTHQQWIHL